MRYDAGTPSGAAGTLVDVCATAQSHARRSSAKCVVETVCADQMGAYAVPTGWSDAMLLLLKKPAETGSEPGHYHPIGLQD